MENIEMDEKELENRIKIIIESIIEKDLIIESGLLDEGILDSLLTVQLLEKIEDAFDIVIDTEDLTHYNFNSISAISAVILKNFLPINR